MCEENISVGAVAEVKIGRNTVVVEVTEILEHGWKVKSQSSGKEFEVSRITRIVSEGENPAPECNAAKKKMSLFEACIAYFRTQPRDRMLNTKQMVDGAVAFSFWEHNGAKTPEQTLYSAIFREISTKEVPRIVKAELRGKFKLNHAAFELESEHTSEE